MIRRLGVSCYNPLSEDVEMTQLTLSTTLKEVLTDSTEDQDLTI